jgi:hypothetical protein
MVRGGMRHVATAGGPAPRTPRDIFTKMRMNGAQSPASEGTEAARRVSHPKGLIGEGTQWDF